MSTDDDDSSGGESSTEYYDAPSLASSPPHTTRISPRSGGGSRHNTRSSRPLQPPGTVGGGEIAPIPSLGVVAGVIEQLATRSAPVVRADRGSGPLLPAAPFPPGVYTQSLPATLSAQTPRSNVNDPSTRHSSAYDTAPETQSSSTPTKEGEFTSSKRSRVDALPRFHSGGDARQIAIESRRRSRKSLVEPPVAAILRPLVRVRHSKSSPSLPLLRDPTAEAEPPTLTQLKSSMRPINVADPESFATLRNFAQLATLGFGSFGCVHRVKNVVSNNDYACKVVHKSKIRQKRHLTQLLNEKRILSQLASPFVVMLHGSFLDNRNVYMILELCGGGELFQLLRKSGRFPPETTPFYASEILIGLEYLHSFKIAYRDLKPENVLLTAAGHCKLCDFGFAKVVPDRTWTFCGTAEYMAPEIITGTGHDCSVDWWAFGILIFEMIAGYPPFHGTPSFAVYEAILEGVIKFPAGFDPLSEDLVRKLLVAQRQLRLGATPLGSGAIRAHGFFSRVDWAAVEKLSVPPPIVPKVTEPSDAHFRDLVPDFDTYRLRRNSDGRIDPADAQFQEQFNEFAMDFPSK